jgi:serine O-acetyltransferase
MRTDLFLERQYPPHRFFMRWWRIGRFFQRIHVPLLPGLFRVLCRILFQADVPMKMDGTVIHPGVRFEGPALVFHHVTLGNAKSLRDGVPVIGQRVLIGTGACILGAVRIGDDCIIGANSVVTRDVPNAHLAFGNPCTLRPVDMALVEKLFGRPTASPRSEA